MNLQVPSCWVHKPQKVHTFSFIVHNIIPQSVKCIHSATKFKNVGHPKQPGGKASLLNGSVKKKVLKYATPKPRNPDTQAIYIP